MGRLRFHSFLGLFCVALGVLGARESPQTNTLAALRAGFANPPLDCRMMVRWWWFGPSIVKPELQRELKAMQQAGIGGVEIQPIFIPLRWMILPLESVIRLICPATFLITCASRLTRPES